MNHQAKRVVVNTGFLYARMAITVFISLYATRLILNALGVEDFGLFNVVGGAIAMLTFLNNAMASATQRFMSIAEGEGNLKKQLQIFNVSIVIHFIIAILLVLVLEVAGYFLFNGILNIASNRLEVAKFIFQFMLVSTFFTIVSVPYDAVINAHENMFLVAILGIIEAVLKLSIAIYISYAFGDKLILYGLFMAILAIFLLILRQIYCHRKYVEVTINIKRHFHKPLFKEMTRFAGWNLLGSSSSMLSGYGSSIILNHFFGTILNAANGIAGQLNGQLLAFSNTMQKALNPVITKSEGSGDRDLMMKASITGSKISFMLYAFFSIPIFLEAPYILKIWLKDVPEWTVVFCRLIIVRVLIEQVSSSLGISISAVGKINVINILKSILAFSEIILLIVLFSFGAPPYTLVIIGILSAFSATIINIQQSIRYCDLKLDVFLKDLLLKISLVLFITLTIASIPGFLMYESFLRLSVTVIVSTIVFIFLFFTVSLTTSEMKIFNNLVLIILKKIGIK